MAHEVTTMFEELRKLAGRHAKLHTNQARLEAQIAADANRRARLEMDVSGLQAELEQTRSRVADLKAESEHQLQGDRPPPGRAVRGC